MQYLIKSNKWTDENKELTFWGPNKNGYDTKIYKAGIYSEKDKEELEKFHSKYIAEFIPLTNELIITGKQQLMSLIETSESYISDYLSYINKENIKIEQFNNELKRLDELIKEKDGTI